jgi:peptide/nickel transport system substrate-binding protein
MILLHMAHRRAKFARRQIGAHTILRMRTRLLAAALAAAFLLACGRETPQPPAEPSAVEEAPRDGGRVVRRLESAVSTLNYLLHTTEDERQVLALIYDPLIDYDNDLAPIPGIAARWESSDAGRTYVLHLDPRAMFSDGVPVRATDVLFTLRKAREEDSLQYSSWFEHVDLEQSVALDERTVRIVFSQARAGQLAAFNISVMPEHIYSGENFQTTDAVIGNGPYVLRKRERDRSILLERNENYWRERPHIDSVLFRPVPDDAVAWKALQRGDLDVSRIDNDLWWRIRDDPEVVRKFGIFDTYHFSYNAIVWNLSNPLFADTRVRRALAMSFDRDAIIGRLYHGQARPVSGPFTPDQKEANPNLEPVDFNLPAARALLASAGWTDSDRDGVLDREGTRFTFTLLVPAGNRPSTEQSQIFQAALRQLGIVMTIEPLDHTAFFERIMNRNFQSAFLAWMNEPEPNPYSLFHSRQIPPNGLNVGGYSNEEADDLLDRARVELNDGRRIALYHDLHELLARDQPYLWTVQVGTKWVVNRRVRNVQTAPGLGLFHWHPGPTSWWVAD